MRQFTPCGELLERRSLTTLVFVLNGNAFGAARPDSITQSAAINLARNGHQAIQLRTQAMDSPGAFYALAGQIKRISQGQPIGLAGFSAGGALALRLAGVPGVNAKAVLNFYGPPDLQDWLSQHQGDMAHRYMTRQVRLTRGFIAHLSGPGQPGFHAVSAFGARDVTVTLTESQASFGRDYPDGRIYVYPGPHGLKVYGCYPAFQDFMDHL